MLLIFDLDDTLILSSPKWKEAIEKMVDAGLILPSKEEAVEEIRALDRRSLSAKEALRRFFLLHQVDEKYFAIGYHEIYHNFSFDQPVPLAPSALELLTFLKQDHLLALVTRGDEQAQRMKLEKSGIDSALFSKIIVCSGSKLEAYQMMVLELQISPDEVIVCGDRVGVDLTPAKALGFTTVHIAQGRGAVPQEGSEADVDFRIHNLIELKQIILERIPL